MGREIHHRLWPNGQGFRDTGILVVTVGSTWMKSHVESSHLLLVTANQLPRYRGINMLIGAVTM